MVQSIFFPTVRSRLSDKIIDNDIDPIGFVHVVPIDFSLLKGNSNIFFYRLIDKNF